jgi:phenylacetate-CoA ligase
MADHFDARETQDPARREADLLARLPGLVEAALRAPGWRRHLGDVDPRAITSRAALARLPIMRKSDLVALQRAAPPFADLVPASLDAFGRLFSSPGPIYEPEGRHDDAWRVGRGLFAAGFRAGDIVLNTFSYHLTPGGFLLDGGARAVGCAVIPAGPGNTEQQLDVIAHLRPNAYAGTPDFLKILLDAAQKAGKDATSIKKASVSGAAFPPSLQAELRARGIDAYQMYATADVGVIAYESAAREGLIVNEDVLIEIVRPGTGDPVPDGDVGEVVITSFDADHPWVRLALGDLSAVLPGVSPCGRTNVRIKGWMGRADQTTKVKGMFVRPEQIAEMAKRHPVLGRLRLVVSRKGETDSMTLRAECAQRDAALTAALGETLRAITKLGGEVELVAPGSLPNDGKVIEDARSYT